MVKHETEYDISDAREFNPELRGDIEAQIANVADELTYTAHDLDDGLRSGMINASMLEGMALWEIVLKSIDWSGTELDDITRHRIVRRLIGIGVNDLTRSTDQRVRSVDELQRLPYNVVSFSDDMRRRSRELKDFLYANLYRHYRVMRMAVKAEHIITALYEAYCAEPRILPKHVQDLIPERTLERTVADYIAGMTDRFAIEEHTKLFDPTRLP
jgi:dGTPase